MTVYEHVHQTDYTKLWLCPSLVTGGKIHIHPLLRGIECAPGTVPKALYNKEVRRTFNDAGRHCIIWENDGVLPSEEEEKEELALVEVDQDVVNVPEDTEA